VCADEGESETAAVAAAAGAKTAVQTEKNGGEKGVSTTSSVGLKTCVVTDPDPSFYLNADPDPSFYLNADPDPSFYLNADPDPDPDSSFYLNADSDQDPSFYLNADPDPSFDLNADPNPGMQGAKPMRIHSDSDQTFKSQKVKAGQKNNISKYKSLFKWQEPGLFVNFCQFLCSWIRIRIPNTDPDPGPPNECGSGSTALLKTVFVKIYF
jgi:hypothetical protein